MTLKTIARPLRISAFFPAYNDALSLPGLIENAFDVLSQCTDAFEVIVVNDGSRDHTRDVLNTLRKRFGPRLRVVEHEENQGYGAALRSGFHSSRYEFVFYTDGDGQYDVRQLPLLIERIQDNIGLVNGYKLNRADAFHRIAIGRLYNTVVRILFSVRLRDIDCDFRLIRRNLLRNVDLRSTSGCICIELVRAIERTGCGVAEAPIRHRERAFGSSQFFRVRPLVATAVQLSALYFRLVVGPALGLSSAPHGPQRDPLCLGQLPAERNTRAFAATAADSDS